MLVVVEGGHGVLLAPVVVHLLDHLLLVLVLDPVEDPVDGAEVDEVPRAAPEGRVLRVRVRLGRGKLLHLDRRMVGAEARVATLAWWPTPIGRNRGSRVQLQSGWLLDDLVLKLQLGVIWVPALGFVAPAVSLLDEALHVSVHAPDGSNGWRLSWLDGSPDRSRSKEAGTTHGPLGF